MFSVQLEDLCVERMLVLMYCVSSWGWFSYD